MNTFLYSKEIVIPSFLWRGSTRKEGIVQRPLCERSQFLEGQQGGWMAALEIESPIGGTGNKLIHEAEDIKACQ